MKVLVTGSTLKIGMAAVSNLMMNGCTVIGADEKELPFNIYSRHLKSHFIHAPFTDNKYYDDILSIIGKEKPDVLIPIGGTQQISLHKNEISKFVNLLVPDYESYRKAYDKKETYKICRTAGIDMPEHFTDDEAKYLLRKENNRKLVIKPDFDIGGSQGFRIINSIEELNSAGRFIKNKLGNYIIEEFIPGASRTRSLQLLFNKHNKLISYFILKKIHQWPVTGGNTAYAVSTHEFELLEFVLPFFEICRWEGPAGVQLIIDERDNKPKLIEINPRFTGSLAFAVHSGINLPFNACMAAVNKDNLKPAPYKAGKFYIHYSFYLKAIMKEFRISRKKFRFLIQILKEILQKKVGVIIDAKDFPVYLMKALTELKH